MPNAIPVYNLGTAAPSDSSVYHQKGEFVFNSSPDAGEAMGWVCVTAGYPGTWRTVGAVGDVSASSFTVASVLTTGAGLVICDGGNTYTLAPVASHVAGFRQTVKNINATTITLATVAGATYQDAAAITLAQNASVTLISDGAIWHRAQ